MNRSFWGFFSFQYNGSNTNNSPNSTSPSWYIILGIVLGLAFILCLILIFIYLFKDNLLPEKCRSKLLHNDNNVNNSYERMIRNSPLSSQTNFPSNVMKPNRISITTSTYEADGQGHRMLQFVC